jgi:16S rRNA (guanine(966)-N(2))-methyltransferase RsmD
MRIIAGKYRGRRLKSPPSDRTRPTSDRLRETLFNVIAPRIEGARFLDLCAGTGAIGIEALSRGAEHVTFVDQSRQMCELIETNVSALSAPTSEFAIVNADAFDFLRKRKSGTALLDSIFFDPPYSAEYERVLNFIGEHACQLLTGDAVVVVEHRKQRLLSEEFGLLKRYRELKQGDSVLSFYRLES